MIMIVTFSVTGSSCHLPSLAARVKLIRGITRRGRDGGTDKGVNSRGRDKTRASIRGPDRDRFHIQNVNEVTRVLFSDIATNDFAPVLEPVLVHQD